jgi:hypothetical protein
MISCSLEDEISPGEVLEDKGKGLVFGLRGKGRSIMDVVGLLVGWANDDCPVALENGLELYFDFL